MLIDQAYKSISDLNLWLKTQQNDLLVLGDVPELIPLRWTYLRDNWSTLKPQLEKKVASYTFPSLLTSHISDFTTFVNSQRNSQINPLKSTTTQKKYYAVFDALEINLLSPSPREAEIVDKATSRVKRFIKGDFLTIRANIIAARDEMADVVGGADEDYNRIFGRSSVPQLVDPTIKSLAEMQVMQTSITAVDFILANIYSLQSTSVDPFALAKQNANNPDINISSYASGKLVKLDYGKDLKWLASVHLSDPDKWIDIAIANGLKPPYIDEIGTRIDLIANGSGSLINLGGLDSSGQSNADKLFINQVIFLQSTVEKSPEKRTIVNITQVPISNELILELSGDADLDRYTLVDNAHIRVYKANTVNSAQYILIPSAEPVELDTKADVPWFLTTSGEDERRAKVDFLLGEDYDLKFTASGDVQLSYGLENAIQALKLKMLVERGSLLKQKGFGLVAVQGSRTTDTDQVRQALITNISDQIISDSRFDRLESLSVVKRTNGNTGANLFLVKVVVRLAGSGTNIPITFSINPN